MANEITSANVATAIVKLVASQFLQPVVGSLVMGNLVNRNYESTLAAAGDVVNVPIAPNMTANNIAEAGSVTNQQKVLGNAQVVLNRHIEASFAVPDVTKVLAVPDLLALYTQSAVIAIAEQIETDLLSTYAQFNYNTAAGSGNTSLTEASVDTAETTLFTSKVPAAASKYLVVSGTVYGQLRQLARFSEFQMTGPSGQPSPMMTGQLAAAAAAGGQQGTGTVKGLTVFRSQYVQKPSTTTFNLCFAQDALALVVRTLPLPMPGTGAIGAYANFGNFGMRIIMSYTPSQLQQQFTVDCLYGVGVLRNNFGIQVLA
jgi:hypothetical protein